ncbi:hypothetical protein [Streptococcus suis]|uniref:hypothetical protein n=1 Tax=Streptococcus suis TaxID=1307 RepID=UPI00163A5C53|nr:hypothetical protein [Streptococcus suis]
MPASGAVDGGLCAVGAGGEVERGVGRYSSAIYGKEKDMRPKRYPYMQKEPTAVTVDSGKIVLGNWTKEQIDSTKQI